MILFHNGIIDSTQNLATALAVEGSHIVAIGSDYEILNLSRHDSVIFDLHGKTIWPGLIDSHLHFEMYSLSLAQVNCETGSIDECINLVKQKAQATPAGEWILGQGWNQNTWGNYGTATQLDVVSQGHPAFLSDKSIHAAWVNSKALSIAGIHKQTQDPTGGAIQRDAHGEPTGILFENAVSLVESLIPAPSETQLLSQMRIGQRELHSLGLTAIHDFDRASCFSALQRMRLDGELTLRVTKSLPVESIDEAIAIGLRSGFGDDYLHIGSVKLFADGALGPQTASMLTPYENSVTDRGTLLLTADDIFEIGMKATRNGLSLAIHAIGDNATNQVLNGLSMVRQYETTHGLKQQSHRIEHLQLLHPDDLARVMELNVIASMQPIHVISDMFTADKHWGKRAKYAYAFASLLKHGTTLIFGSDAPVESPNPFFGIHAAVTRRRPNGEPGENGWYPSQRLTLQQAKKAFTEWPANVSGHGNKFGRLEPGMLADLIILAHNPEEIGSEELLLIQPENVMVNGTWVYNR
jgi:predicted amidohydrolase YtcJ